MVPWHFLLPGQMCIRDSDEDYHREISLEIARHLQNVINLEREQSILVVGLGNSAITADSLGPHVVENLHITRHRCV